MTIGETTLRDAVLGNTALGTGPGTTTRAAGRRPMRVLLIASAAVTGLAALTACGGGSSTAATSATTSAAATPQAGASTDDFQVAGPSARAGSVPTPEGDQRTTLVTILEAIDPGVGTDADLLVKKSVEVCGRMLKGESGDALDKDVEKVFANGSYKPGGLQDQAFELSITQTFCR